MAHFTTPMRLALLPPETPMNAEIAILTVETTEMVTILTAEPLASTIIINQPDHLGLINPADLAGLSSADPIDPTDHSEKVHLWMTF